MTEAVSLLHAQLAYLAGANGIRYVLIKGPTVIDQGLRKPRQSTDVDIWVDPEAFEGLVNDLTGLGWRRRPTDPFSSPFPSHSLTLYNSKWPCDIDMHFRIPGMEAEPRLAFDVVWSSRQQHSMAGIQISVPSTESSRLILALHSLRSMETSREPLEYDYLVEQTIDSFDEFHLLATATGSVSALKPFLVDTCVASRFGSINAPSSEWVYLTSSKSNADKRIDTILNSSFSKVPLALWRAVFPSTEALQVHDLYQDTSPLGLLRTNLRRYRRGFNAIRRRIRI